MTKEKEEWKALDKAIIEHYKKHGVEKGDLLLFETAQRNFKAGQNSQKRENDFIYEQGVLDGRKGYIQKEKVLEMIEELRKSNRTARIKDENNEEVLDWLISFKELTQKIKGKEE